MGFQDEKELIRKAISKDQTAFNLLFDKYWNSVYSFLFLRTQSSNIAEELAIESFTKAFDRLDKFDHQHSFGSWLITIAKNHQIDRYRKLKKQNENHKEFDAISQKEILNKVPSPEELMISNQNLDKVLEHIKSMKKEFRNLIRMRYFEDLSLKEIEKILREPPTTIRVKLFRAKKMLASLIEQNDI